MRSKQVLYEGMLLDSILELKFVLMVEDKCVFVRKPLTIRYNRNNLDLTIPSECNHRYTPDFLVRKLSNNKAFLIEVKPEKFQSSELAILNKQIAERYIERKGHDWEYKFISEHQIDNYLTANKREKLSEIRKTRKTVLNKLNLAKKHAKYSDSLIQIENRIPHREWPLNFVDDRDYIYYVKKGFYKFSEGYSLD